MTDEIRYLVLCKFGTDTEQVLGPFKTESDALLAKNVVEQMPYPKPGSGARWGEGDTYVVVEKRETITL